VEAPERLRGVLRLDDERHVRLRGPLGDEDHVDVAERPEDARGDARRRAELPPDDGDDGEVAEHGDLRELREVAEAAIERLAALGVARFVYTPVEVDGTLAGPGLGGLDPVLEACERSGAKLIYSGGVGTLADLETLRDLGAAALEGVIVGRALYERRFSVAEALAALAGSES